MSTPQALRRFNTHKHFDDTILPHSVVEVHFNEVNYTVGESEGQVSLSLRITGQFFIPVYAIIEVTDGTATGVTGGTAVGNNMYYWYTCTAIHGINERLCLHHYLSYTLTPQPNIKIMYVYPYFQTLRTTLLVQEGST